MAKEHNLSKTQYLLLHGYLYDLHPDKELVDSIMADIDEAVLNKEVRLKELQEAREVAEKTRYEELKAKYEGEL